MEEKRVYIGFENLDAFKSFLRYGMSRSPLEVGYDFLTLESKMDVYSMYGHPLAPDLDEWWSMKVVMLYAYYRDSKDYKLELIWTDAHREEDVKVMVPDLLETNDPKLLTYDFEEFSRKIDYLVSPEGHELRWQPVEGYDLPF